METPKIQFSFDQILKRFKFGGGTEVSADLLWQTKSWAQLLQTLEALFSAAGGRDQLEHRRIRLGEAIVDEQAHGDGDEAKRDDVRLAHGLEDGVVVEVVLGVHGPRDVGRWVCLASLPPPDSQEPHNLEPRT